MAVGGASRGLGYAIAHELAREGAQVAICSRSAEAIEGAAGAIREATGAEVVPVVADMAAPDGPRTFVDAAAEAFGGLQVLVANSGGPPPSKASEFDEGAWAKALDGNLVGSVRMATAALPHLRRRPWGRIVFLTSLAVKQPIASLPLSNAARSGLTAYAKSLSSEIAAEGITVNCLMPGFILTDRIRSLAGAPAGAGLDDPAIEAWAKEIPTGRVGLAEEFAAVAAFLCSARASYVTGSSIQVDGGLSRSLL